jgi:thiol:disulfide interchange protein DsbD
MKKFYVLATLFIVSLSNSFSQTSDYVTWSFISKKKQGNTYEVTVTATIAKPWHIYSQNTGVGGPLPTTFKFNPNPLVTVEGKVKETGKLVKVYDKNFKTDVLFYGDKVVFTQIVKTKAAIKTNITGTISYMLCDDEKCLAPTKKTFDIKLQ